MQYCGKRVIVAGDALDILKPMLYRAAVASTLGSTPCHDTTISLECGERPLRAGHGLHIILELQ